jgi:hypothetical protein
VRCGTPTKTPPRRRSFAHPAGKRTERARSPVATRRNDDGTTSFVTIDPGVNGFEFVPAQREGKRTLVIRDGQHEYVYTETT